MADNNVHDLFNRALSAVAPVLAVMTPHIVNAYFATRRIDPEIEIEFIEHVVEKEDSLESLALTYDTSAKSILKENKIRRLKVGSALIIATEKVVGERHLFERSNANFLGADLFIVVETLNAKDMPIEVKIKQGRHAVLAEIDKELEVATINQRATSLKAKVGAYGVDNELLNKDDLKYLAIIPIRIEPKENEEKKSWTDKIFKSTEGLATLYLSVDAHTESGISKEFIQYYGHQEGHQGLPNEWLNEDGLWFRLIGRRAPWMEIVVEEARKYKGMKESTGDLKDRIKDAYHEYVNPGKKKDHGNSWCASFASWAIHESGYSEPTSPSSQAFVDANEKFLRKIHGPVYGAIATWSNSYDKKKFIYKGHVGFVFGKLPNSDGSEDYLILGGNQGDTIKVSKKDCTGKFFKAFTETIKEKVEQTDGTFIEVEKKVPVYRKFRSFYVPKDYTLRKSDFLIAQDVYKNDMEANLVATTKAMGTKKGEST